MLKILVIEDKTNHLRDIRELLERRKAKGINIDVDYSTDYADAEKKLQTKSYDGVMTDIFFPQNKNKTATDPLGLRIGDHALELGIPVVFVSDINIHRNAHDVLDVIRSKYKQEGYYAEFEDVTGTKLWKQAFVGLMFLIEGVKNGSITIDTNGVHSDLFLYDISQSCLGLPDIGGDVYIYEGSYLKICKFKNGKEIRRGKTLAELNWLKKRPTTLEAVLFKHYIKIPFFSIILEKYCKGLFDK